MKKVYNIFLMGILSVLGGCADDFPQVSGNSQTNLPTVDAYLSLSVNDFSISSAATRDAEPSGDTEEVSEGEKRIENIWVFQYDKTSHALLNTGIYRNISSAADLGDIVNNGLKVELVPGESIICVVANTSDNAWGDGTTFDTYEKLKNSALPNPEPIFLDEINSTDAEVRKSIPMEGEKSAIVGQGAKIQIDVTRMFAKLKISFGDLQLSGNDEIKPKSIEINNIPNYCRVETVGKDLTESSAYSYANDLEWITRAFSAEEEEAKNKEYVLYVPENIQGEVANSENDYKGNVAPTNALGIKLTMTNTYQVAEMGGAWFEEDVQYNIYPGGNNRNNFNVRRNNVYRLKTNINAVDVHNPSSNCFVVVPGDNLAFEPYYRTEKGGVDNPNLVPSTDNPFPDPNDPLRFENYLTPLDEDKKIAKVEIIWQDKDVIGDNSDGTLVKFIANNEEPYHSKIYVKTNPAKIEGNALVGAFNSKGEVIWSWHIWVAAHDPANVGKAVVYTTYDWNNDKIFSYSKGLEDGTTYERIPGYAVMSCNLGALADVPTPALTDDEMNETHNRPSQSREEKIAKTFGMLYQWGRKDPFPPMIRIQQYDHDYDEYATGIHWDNSNNKQTPKTGWGKEKLNSGSKYTDRPYARFYSVLGNTNEVKGTDGTNSIKYSIANPCVFICGTKEIKVGDRNNASDTKIRNAVDDWCQDSENYFNSGDWNALSNSKLWGGLDPTTSGLKKFSYTITDTHEGNHNSNIFNNYGSEKSIFDPCPSGWRVPPGELWLGFTKTGLNPERITQGSTVIKEGLDDVNYNLAKTGASGIFNAGGMYLYMTKSKWDRSGNVITNPGRDLFFPTQGSREGSGNSLRVSYCGNYHNATTDYDNKVNILHIHNQGGAFKIFESFYSYTAKSMAAPIRCVRDRK